MESIHNYSGIQKIISGGQSGVDRAALDTALEKHYQIGGWCPHGRRAEDGPIPKHYPLRETQSPAYPMRTELNIMDADASLILFRYKMDPGTALTKSLCRKHHKPYFTVDLSQQTNTEAVLTWLHSHQVEILNVAGSRESNSPGIYQLATAYLTQLLQPLSS